MLTILSSRQNKRKTVLSIGYTTDKEESKMFCDYLSKSIGLKRSRKGNYGIQKGTKKAK